jgi:hypothetical protein
MKNNSFLLAVALFPTLTFAGADQTSANINVPRIEIRNMSIRNSNISPGAQIVGKKAIELMKILPGVETKIYGEDAKIISDYKLHNKALSITSPTARISITCQDALAKPNYVESYVTRVDYIDVIPSCSIVFSANEKDYGDQFNFDAKAQVIAPACSL